MTLRTKRNVLFFILICIVIIKPELTKAAPLSAVRSPTETYQSALRRNLSHLLSQTEAREDSVLNHQTSFEGLTTVSIPQVQDQAIVYDMYRKLRDTRAWVWDEMGSFPRRLSWLYPGDGCFLRTELMVQKLKEWGYVRPKQIFAFGDLSFSTPYEKVTWWYHVAPTVKFGSQVYVIDPALDYQRPLLLKEWVQRISKTLESTQFALCEAGAVSPEDSCSSLESTWDQSDREATLQEYLGSEWTNLEAILGESPTGILGDFPPWMTRMLLGIHPSTLFGSENLNPFLLFQY